ncbi:MAG: RDD family protein [Helicobacter sp.]|nr:RDD family protein [Helicobacter sp.]MDE6044626.1 RDD family protein [Helicobacter sp.]MDE7197200.1 RDD family protein [Helicobacter sp.]
MKTENDRIEETLERENLKIPNLQARISAYIVDDALLSLIVLATVYGDITALKVENGIIDGNALMGIILTLVPLSIILVFVYHWLFIALYGSTLGKMLCKIRVVDTTMLDNPSYKQAAIRSAIRLISAMLYYLPFIAIFADPFRRGFHDKLAKTIALSLD